MMEARLLIGIMSLSCVAACGVTERSAGDGALRTDGRGSDFGLGASHTITMGRVDVAQTGSIVYTIARAPTKEYRFTLESEGYEAEQQAPDADVHVRLTDSAGRVLVDAGGPLREIGQSAGWVQSWTFSCDNTRRYAYYHWDALDVSLRHSETYQLCITVTAHEGPEVHRYLTPTLRWKSFSY